MPVVTALTTFTILTIGDGLVTAIPSLLISIAGGLVTTRAASDMSMGEEVSIQLFSNPKPVYFGSGIVASLGLIPGFPEVLVLPAGRTARLSSRTRWRQPRRRRAKTPRRRQRLPKDKDAATPDKATSFLQDGQPGHRNRLRPDRHCRCCSRAATS